MSDWTLHEAPALDIDAAMARRGSPQTSTHATLERRAVAYILDKLQSAGFQIESVHDGEVNHPVHDTKSAMEIVFDLDESRVYMARDGEYAGLLLFILGNEPEEVLADWSWPRDDPEGMNRVLEAITNEMWGIP